MGWNFTFYLKKWQKKDKMDILKCLKISIRNLKHLCLWSFVLFGFFYPTWEISLIWRCHHCQWRAANFDLCSALMAIEQWGFFNMPNILWHKAFVYNSHLRDPVTLTPIADRLAVELSLPVFTTKICCSWDLNTQPSACCSCVHLWITHVHHLHVLLEVCHT